MLLDGVDGVTGIGVWNPIIAIGIDLVLMVVLNVLNSASYIKRPWFIAKTIFFK